MQTELSLYVKSMGKVFRIRHIALTTDSANEYCARHTECGVIAEDRDSGAIFVAEINQIRVPSSILPD